MLPLCLLYTCMPITVTLILFLPGWTLFSFQKKMEAEEISIILSISQSSLRNTSPPLGLPLTLNSLIFYYFKCLVSLSSFRDLCFLTHTLPQILATGFYPSLDILPFFLFYYITLFNLSSSESQFSFSTQLFGCSFNIQSLWNAHPSWILFCLSISEQRNSTSVPISKNLECSLIKLYISG